MLWPGEEVAWNRRAILGAAVFLLGLVADGAGVGSLSGPGAQLTQLLVATGLAMLLLDRRLRRVGGWR